MAKRNRRRKCLNCGELFRPDHRNRKKQKYCSKKVCRAASKKASNDRWRARKENRNYFCGPDHVARVQEWRRRNPGCHKKPRLKSKPLQDDLNAGSPTSKGENGDLNEIALQDYLNRQSPVIIGLIAHLTANMLQDDIAQTFARMRQLGRDILSGVAEHNHHPIQHTGGSYDNKTTNRPNPHPQGAGKIQLGGSPPGSRSSP